MNQEIDIHEIQQIELEILKDLKRVCEKNNIMFFLGEGTLLGAIRHKGFIPWDDDVDVLMKREDYNRFLSIAQQMGDQYEVQHSTTVENFWSPIIKIRLVKGPKKYYQQHIAHLTDHNGPYVDIFPVDYVPKKTSLSQRWQSIQIRLFRGMLSLKLGLYKPDTSAKKVIQALSRFYSVQAIHKKLNHLFARYQSCGKTEYMATLSSYHPYQCQVVPAQVYDEMIAVEFEDTTMPVPAGYDLLLTTIYNDYLSLPPENQRCIKHHFSTYK